MFKIPHIWDYHSVVITNAHTVISQLLSYGGWNNVWFNNSGMKIVPKYNCTSKD